MSTSAAVIPYPSINDALVPSWCWSQADDKVYLADPFAEANSTAATMQPNVKMANVIQGTTVGLVAKEGDVLFLPCGCIHLLENISPTVSNQRTFITHNDQLLRYYSLLSCKISGGN